MKHQHRNTAFSNIILILLLGFALSVNAQEVKDNTGSLLWKIEHPDLEKASYLFGTVHIIPEADFIFTDSMKAAFDACDQLILEIDINIPLMKQIAIAKEMYLPDGKRISDYLNEKEYTAYRNILITDLGISATTVNLTERMYPIFSSGLFITELLDNPVQYESFLNKRAKKNKMTVEGLESIDFQMETVKNISLEEQLDMLRDTAGLRHMKTEYGNLITAYINQDLEKLSLAMEEEELSAGTETALLSDRNKNWIPLIDKAVRKKSNFIAVGAGHLPGENGLIKLLREQGYTISKVQ